MNIDTRILKLLANEIQQYRKRIYDVYKEYVCLNDIKIHNDQVGFIPGIQG